MLFYSTPCLPQRINGNVINSQNVYRSIYNPPPSNVPTPTLVGAKTLNGLYGQGNRTVFSDDQNSHQAPQVTSTINFNPMGASMIRTEGVGNGIPSETNGSLTGSLVLTNETRDAVSATKDNPTDVTTFNFTREVRLHRDCAIGRHSTIYDPAGRSLSGRTQNEPFYTGSLPRLNAAVRTKHSISQQRELSKTTKSAANNKQHLRDNGHRIGMGML
ncbi:hypothetical protein PHET_08377 [Paragonimus heterotremus]|uniref:Uncharacterized protein n=1 Tax=Paragonimus heterotremus TaxID=100268 RepID=A0A8J4WPH7_9TREM|nr:hypothetical protein PHET_08377 [Paragonimus heterotremus]